MENQFKKFNEDFFSKCKRTIKWFDQQGLFVMDKNRVVTITIDDVGVNGNFNGYLVEIINNQSGTITKKFFRFQHHMEFNHRDKNSHDKYYHVWSKNSGEFDWYISKPKDTNEMCNTIFEWVDTFQ